MLSVKELEFGFVIWLCSCGGSVVAFVMEKMSSFLIFIFEIILRYLQKKIKHRNELPRVRMINPYM
jgi:hypothetical protein